MSKVCIVTGGTRGIGFATVEAFLKDGYKVVLYGSRKETVEKALEELNHNPDVSGRFTSLTDEEAINRDFDEIKAELGSIDVLINNAGISDSTKFADYTVEK